ncbi:MAG: DNA-binding response regulator [Paenibacillaceae bacterium]|jgi:two-component system response regulator YesN|nr:DNA-binding response regulator [Paenibacillaceae bacterium]
MQCRCLIVDDEEMTLERLSLFLGAHRDEFILAGQAHSGSSGYALALELKPDIVITDIKMPGMSGMEMIEALRPQLPHTEFVILSAYSDFGYAKQAISMKVQEYMVKVPLSEEELLAVLRRVRSQLLLLRSRQEEIQRMVQQRLAHAYRLRRQVMGELIRGNLSPGKIQEFAESMNADLAVFSGYHCLLVEWSGAPGFLLHHSVYDQGLMRYGMINIIEETIGETARGFACEWSDERLLAIVAWPPTPSSAERLARSVEMGQRIIMNIKTYFRQQVHAAVSGHYKGWEQLRQAYAEAASLCGNSYYYSISQVFASGAAPRLMEEHTAAERTAHLREQFFIALRKDGALTALLEMLQGVKAGIMEARLPKASVVELIGDSIELVRHQARADNREIDQWPVFNRQAPGFEEQWEVLVKTVQTYWNRIRNSGKQEIIRVKRYIEEHMDQRLSLEDLAGVAGMAPTYFSALFKRENGESLVDYVNRRKMERAALLLKDREYSNTRLCELLGIQSEKYLCKLFKDVHGIPPQKFRKSIQYRR